MKDRALLEISNNIMDILKICNSSIHSLKLNHARSTAVMNWIEHKQTCKESKKQLLEIEKQAKDYTQEYYELPPYMGVKIKPKKGEWIMNAKYKKNKIDKLNWEILALIQKLIDTKLNIAKELEERRKKHMNLFILEISDFADTQQQLQGVECDAEKHLASEQAQEYELLPWIGG